jgi:DNA-binding transcriptional regulator YdaS (Cro superfamily)
MIASSPTPALAEHFAHCVQVLGGVTAAARRLGIDERAIRRFINGERPISTGLMNDTAEVLRQLVADATEAENQITTILNSAPDAP